MVFIETTIFTRLLTSYLTDEEYLQLQIALVLEPDAGDVVQGTGGIRKVRWKAKGKGKRSGVRVLYYYRDKKQQIYLLTIYAKNEVADLTADEKRLLKKMVEDWKNE